MTVQAFTIVQEAFQLDEAVDADILCIIHMRIRFRIVDNMPGATRYSLGEEPAKKQRRYKAGFALGKAKFVSVGGV